MTRTLSRRKMFAAVGLSAVAGTLTAKAMRAQSLQTRGVKDDYKEDLIRPDLPGLGHSNGPQGFEYRWPIWPRSSRR